MPRRPPAPEDLKIRTTISLPVKVVNVADQYRALHPEENLQDFSAIVAKAIIAYAAQKHPDMLAEVIADLRSLKLSLAAEDTPAAEKKLTPAKLAQAENAGTSAALSVLAGAKKGGPKTPRPRKPAGHRKGA